MASLINSISSGLISGRAAKEVFEIMKNTGGDPVKIIEEKGLKQKSDPKELEAIIDKILEGNKDKVSQFKSGKEKLFGFFVGQAMKISDGTANPQLVNDILKKKLK
jgi:aspartyl-tRNA(Asn)/glutamyl-tRNA(Gln) amidotransferase subunit B